MSNRAGRRAQRKQTPKWEKMSQDQLMKHLSKNGITLKDLERNYELGRKEGIQGTYMTVFASVCLALNDLHGFGRVRCQRVLEQMQEYIINSLCTADAIHQVYKRMGLKFDADDVSSWVRLEDD
jgi:hypothetical protein